VVGPWDGHTLVLFRAVCWRVNFVPGWRDLRMSWVYVGDLVEALVVAAERGRRLLPDEGAERGRGTYFVALDEHTTFEEAGRLAARALGKSLWHTFHVPRPLLRLVAGANGLRARLTRRPILLTADKLAEGLAGPWLCSGGKARQELGVECRVGLAEGLERAAAWYRANGWL
jgi:nucleoside-diphosphate-sugar epimerase